MSQRIEFDFSTGRELPTSERYVLVNCLGEGGFGLVYAAENIRLQSSVAIKFARDPIYDTRIVAEARAMAGLRSTHSVRIFDLDFFQNSRPFLVMELLEGRSLEKYLNDVGTVAPRVALEWLVQLCSSLNEIHGRGFVHCDIKPSNLHLADQVHRGDHIKLIDFGAVRKFCGGKDASTSIHNLGSPAYLSPERILTSNAQITDDIWSLGVLLVQLLTGDLPFQGKDRSSLYSSILRDPPRIQCALRSGPHRQLLTIAARCLQKRVEDRFSCVDDLGVELSKVSQFETSENEESHPQSGMRAVADCSAPISRETECGTIDLPCAHSK